MQPMLQLVSNQFVFVIQNLFNFVSFNFVAYLGYSELLLESLIMHINDLDLLHLKFIFTKTEH